MKKVLVVLMVLVSLSMFGKISEDQYFKKGTHTKWFENFRNDNSYSIEANKFLYTKVLSFYNKNKKVSVVRYICEVIRARNIVETSTIFDKEDVKIYYSLDSYENNFDYKVLDDEIIVFEIKKDFGYAGYVNMKTRGMYLYPYIIFNFDISDRSNDKDISKIIDEINEEIQETPELKETIFDTNAISQFKRSEDNNTIETKKKPKRLGYDN